MIFKVVSNFLLLVHTLCMYDLCIACIETLFSNLNDALSPAELISEIRLLGTCLLFCLPQS